MMRHAGTPADPSAIVAPPLDAIGAATGHDGETRLYGLEREDPTARRSGGWMVRLRRRGRIVARLFKDAVHGSPDAALAQALAYRDAVVAAIPPMTNREQAVRLRRNNTSGVSGVMRKDLADGPTWYVALTTSAGSQRMSFAVAQHGEERARAMALAQRQAWLEALPPAFLVMDAQAAAVTYDRFADTLDRPVDIHPNDAMTVAEMTARLAAIDAHFDALRPPRLRVRVKHYPNNRHAHRSTPISIMVSDAGKRGGARRRLVQLRPSRPALAVIVREVSAVIVELVTALYGPAVAAWFMRQHGRALLAPKHFDPEIGFNLCVIVPPGMAQSTPPRLSGAAVP